MLERKDKNILEAVILKYEMEWSYAEYYN